ncbi:hypothetical protein ACH4U7_52670, partial [Streptomyces sp. NPDC020845]
MEEGDPAAGKSTAAERGAWIVFEDEAGQSKTPPRAGARGRMGQTPVVRVRGRGSGRVSVAGMACLKPGRRSRLIPAIREYRGRTDELKGFGWRVFRDLVVLISVIGLGCSGRVSVAMAWFLLVGVRYVVGQ